MTSASNGNIHRAMVFWDHLGEIILVQAWWRKRIALVKFTGIKSKIITCQSVVRMWRDMRQLAYVKRVAKRVKEHISTLRWATLQKECSARGIRTHGRGRTKDVLRYELQLKMIEEELSKAMIDG